MHNEDHMAGAESEFDFDRIESRPRRVTQEVIRAVCQRIIDSVAPERIVLFGSHARGASTKDSDLDMLVIVDSENNLASLKSRERFGQILRLFPHKGFGLDVIVITNKEVQRLIAENEGEWDLVIEILNEGKTLYERKSPTE